MFSGSDSDTPSKPRHAPRMEHNTAIDRMIAKISLLDIEHNATKDDGNDDKDILLQQETKDTKDEQEEEEDTSKQFVDPNELKDKSIELSKKILKSGFRPTFIVALWRGGTPIAMYIQEFFAYIGYKTDHISVKTSSYVGKTQQKEIKVHDLSYIVDRANRNDRLLIVDDIFETGRTVQAVLTQLKQKMRANYPNDVRVATLFVKEGKNKTDFIPDYFVEITSKWIVFPHELEDLSLQEIITHKHFNPFESLGQPKHLKQKLKQQQQQ